MYRVVLITEDLFFQGAKCFRTDAESLHFPLTPEVKASPDISHETQYLRVTL